MPPIYQTLYSFALLFALTFLKLWIDRRHRVPPPEQTSPNETLSRQAPSKEFVQVD